MKWRRREAGWGLGCSKYCCVMVSWMAGCDGQRPSPFLYQSRRESSAGGSHSSNGALEWSIRGAHVGSKESIGSHQTTAPTVLVWIRWVGTVRRSRHHNVHGSWPPKKETRPVARSIWSPHERRTKPCKPQPLTWLRPVSVASAWELCPTQVENVLGNEEPIADRQRAARFGASETKPKLEVGDPDRS